jgi:hypothetical protein
MIETIETSNRRGQVLWREVPALTPARSASKGGLRSRCVPPLLALRAGVRFFRRWRVFACLALLAGLLIVCHGCHGDVDDELFGGDWLISLVSK